MNIKDRIEQFVGLSLAILSVVISIVDFLGIVDWFNSAIPSISLLMLGTIAGYLILERRNALSKIESKLVDLERRYLRIDSFFSVIQNGDRFSEIALVYGLRDLSTAVSYNRIDVGRNNILEFWKDCISGCGQWFSLSYSNEGITWDTGWGDTISDAIQLERIRLGSTIRRIFLLENDNEYLLLLEKMKKQESIGIDVKWVTKQELMKNPLVKEYFSYFDTWSLVIVDDSWVFTGKTDKNKDVIGHSAIRDHDVLKKAKYVFEQAQIKAKNLEQTPELK